jgi:hypothetical protein
LLNINAFAQNPHFPVTLNMKERAEVIDAWLQERVETVLPDIMRRSGIDMWVIIAREYNEDPVIKTLLPATWQAARRTTILVAYDPGEEKPLQTFGISRYNTGEIFKTEWDRASQPDQWKALAEMISGKDPEKIGINKSRTYGLADGLSSTHYDQLLEALPKKYHSRLVSAENIAVGWLETRTNSEMTVYQNIVRMAHQIIAEGLSEKVIQPGSPPPRMWRGGTETEFASLVLQPGSTLRCRSRGPTWSALTTSLLSLKVLIQRPSCQETSSMWTWALRICD